MATDTLGNIYYTLGSSKINQTSADGTVTKVIAGSNTGYLDGDSNEALFNTPQGLTVDKLGNIFVADTGNKTIRKISTTGKVSTIAGMGPSINGVSFGQLPGIIQRPVSIVISNDTLLFTSGNSVLKISNLHNFQ